MRVRATPPFVRIYNDTQEPRTDRLFFAKAMVYAIVAAPFVRLLGLNGFLVFHVLLLAVVVRVRLSLSRRRWRRQPMALGFVLAFFCASVVPVYVVFLTPEIFNFALVFVAYYLWLYKEVSDARLHDFLPALDPTSPPPCCWRWQPT